jgi:crooked neck
MDFEKTHGDETLIADVERLMPRRVKRRRQITAADGTDSGWEEYFDYVFPQDQGQYLNHSI